MARNDDGDALSPDPLVKRLVPSPEDVPNLVAVSGWLGKSTKKTHLRLYLTPSMSAHLEIPANEIVHAEKVGGDKSGLGGTMLWLDRGAKVRFLSSEPMPLEAVYLEGLIAGLPIPPPYVGSLPFPETRDPRTCHPTQFPATRFWWLCNSRPMDPGSWR